MSFLWMLRSDTYGTNLIFYKQFLQNVQIKHQFMVDVILDTNIWIHHIALDNPTGIFDNLKEQIKSEQVYLLSNEIIIEEWRRNKQTTIDNVVKAIKTQSKNALEVKEFLNSSDKKVLEDLLKKYASKEEERITLAKNRIEEIEQLILSATQTKITPEMKLQVVDWALLKRAPFTIKNNSVGDALILLSAVEHRRKYIEQGFIPKGFFVSFNHTDYADKLDKDTIHKDLVDLLEDGNMEYKRNIGEVLHLTPELNMEIENYIDMQIEMYKDRMRGL